jgi:hypothetical protein
MISRIIQTEVNVICRSEAEADNLDRGMNNCLYHAKAESNNCFIIHLKTRETYKTIPVHEVGKVQFEYQTPCTKSNVS